MSEIRNLEPKLMWEYFYQLTQIPRPSKKEQKVIEYTKKFGEDLGLETIVDEVGNVIIRKPATPGMEDRKGIVFQGHLDMVPQANSDKDFNFETDAIQTLIDGDWVTADGTTLGADNGMGLAAAMAVLASNDLVHGPLEALFTVDEETGMTGAFELKPGLLKGDILLNMDSEDEGELYVGCAGGVDANIDLAYSTEALPANVVACNLVVKGLKGGHSGMDIPLGRGNANKILFRFLKYNAEKLGIRLASVNGGSLRNAIPREATATVVAPAENKAVVEKALAEYAVVVASELKAVEPEFEFVMEGAELPANIFSVKDQNTLTNVVYGLPNGVIRMSNDMEGLVETSTNLAIVKSNGTNVEVCCLIRSSVDSAKDDLKEMMRSIIDLTDGTIVFDGEYPGWKPNMDSAILKTMQDVYEKNWGKVPEIRAIHAGLECGVLGGVYPNWDMISFGPTIRFPHSPDEKVHIASVQKFWDFLVETLKNVPKK